MLLMLSELLHDRAALYVSGVMTATERENFELVLAFHTELGAHIANLQDVVSHVVLAYGSTTVTPPEALKQRLLDSISTRPQSSEVDAIVVTGPTGATELSAAAKATSKSNFGRGRCRGNLGQPGVRLRDGHTGLAQGELAFFRDKPERFTGIIQNGRDGDVGAIESAVFMVVDQSFPTRAPGVQGVADTLDGGGIGGRPLEQVTGLVAFEFAQRVTAHL